MGTTETMDFVGAVADAVVLFEEYDQNHIHLRSTRFGFVIFIIHFQDDANHDHKNKIERHDRY